MSASEMSMSGGQPSITTPMPPPCDSPKVVTRKSWPNVLPILEHCSTGILPVGLPGVSPGSFPIRRPRRPPAPQPRRLCYLLDHFECALQIVNEIAHVFDANGQSDQRIADTKRFALFLRHGSVCH